MYCSGVEFTKQRNKEPIIFSLLIGLEKSEMVVIGNLNFFILCLVNVIHEM